MKPSVTMVALLMFTILFSTIVSGGQRTQYNRPNVASISSVIISGRNGLREMDRELLSAYSSNHRFPEVFGHPFDGLPIAKYTDQVPCDKYPSKMVDKNSGVGRGSFSLSANMSVIDTAIVYSTSDTTRHLYSFNEHAKKTSDLTQLGRIGVWLNLSRETYFYDANGNILTYLWERWKGGQWVNDSRDTYSYDANGNMLTHLIEVWWDGQWEISVRHTYSYDANGNTLIRLYEQWSGGTLESSSRYIATYDANGNMLTYLVEQWSSSQWLNDHRYTATYDANGNMLTDLVEQWSSGHWLNEHRYTATYDASGNALTHLVERWSAGQWVNDSRITYTYDANGNRLTSLSVYWSGEQWVNYSRDTYSYDANGNTLTWLYEQCLDGQWVNDSRFTYTYDASGNTLTDTAEHWSNEQWVNYYRYTYKYDANNNLTSASLYAWSITEWTPLDLFLNTQDSVGNDYFLVGYNITLIRKVIVTDVATDRGNMPARAWLEQNYPNPFNPTSTVSYQLPNESKVRLTISNVLGQEVRTLVNTTEQAGKQSVQFDATGLPSGIYFYHLDATSVSTPTNHFSQTRKMLLVK